jgi:hypothetical protein
MIAILLRRFKLSFIDLKEGSEVINLTNSLKEVVRDSGARDALNKLICFADLPNLPSVASGTPVGPLLVLLVT